MISHKALRDKRAELARQEFLSRGEPQARYLVEQLRKEVEDAERALDRLASKRKRIFKGQTRKRAEGIVCGKDPKLGSGIK